MTIKELDCNTFDTRNFGDFFVESCPVVHNPESIAYKIKSLNNFSIIYSRDTDFSENLINLSKNADVLICKSAHPDQLRVKKHSTPSLAGSMATEANVKHLSLTHFYPECDQEDIKKQCRKTYKWPLNTC